jgi:SPOR domain
VSMRFEYRATGPIAAAFILALLTACSRTQQDWRVAQQAGTAQSYNVFVARHPDSELAGVARQRIAQLTEEAAWQQATRANTVAAYQDYLAKYPNGSWSQDARIRMESKSLAAQTTPDGPNGGAPAATEPAAQADPARPAPAVVPHPGPAASETPSGGGPYTRGHGGGVAVQLGAFSSVGNAHSAWNQLSSRFRRELRGLTPQTVPVVSSGRRLYRLEARVADQAAARRLCRQLQQHSQGCLPVP